MQVLNCINVNDAYKIGLRYLCEHGEASGSRVGEVLVSPTPVTIVYAKPQERVLFDPSRDANPAFHLFEALWMLAGRNDATYLDQFVKDFSSRFAETGGIQHGAYGFRWREHFDIEGGGNPNLPDQIETVIHMLAKDHTTRRAVIAMWDPAADLGVEKRDLPCNDIIFLRIRSHTNFGKLERALDMMVCCRSNDLVWGGLGSNAVHFSMLQEYLAGRLNVGVGTLTHSIMNLHLYTDVLNKLDTPITVANYPERTPIGNVWAEWDSDLAKFMAWTSVEDLSQLTLSYRNSWFTDTAEPMYFSHRLWKEGQKQQAYTHLDVQRRMSADWKRAAMEWMERRLKRAQKRELASASK